MHHCYSHHPPPTPLLDVLTSQQTLIPAQQQLIQARLNYRNARAQIEAAIGHDLP